MVKITNLNKYFYRNKNNEIHVINDTTIEFPKVGLVAILGESGCGKTTLMNVLGGLDKFDSGTIEIDEYKISSYKSRKIDQMRNEKIGYVFQNYLLLPQETVYNNLLLVLNMYNLSNAEKKERIEYVLGAVGMLKQKNKKAYELSGGQQQRVAIARALIKAPSLILADEPTGNLDEKNTIQIMNIIKKISETTLVILVSHEQSIAKCYADYIIEISDGKVVSLTNNDNQSSYSLSDDLVLHLKDYDLNEVNNDNINLNFYTNENIKLTLNIVYERGKFFIQSPNNVILLDNKSEISMRNDHKKVVDIDDNVLNNDFHLSKLEYVNTPKLSFKEKYKIATSNLKNNHKRSLFLYISLFIMACLTMWCIQSMFSSQFIDKKNLASSDSHFYIVNVEKGNANMDQDEWIDAYSELYDSFTKKYKDIEIIPTGNYDLSFKYSSFIQIKSTEYELKKAIFSDISTIKPDALIYGRMPENPSEVVIDEWIAEKLINSTNLKNMIPISNLINEELQFEVYNTKVKISGIVRTNNNTIYANKWFLLFLYPSAMRQYGTHVIPLSEYKKYPNTNQDLTLDDNEIFTSNALTHGYTENIYYEINSDPNMKFKVKSEVPFLSNPFTIVVPDSLPYEKVLASASCYNHDKMVIHCENESEKEQVKAYFDEMSKYYKTNQGKELNILHESIYDKSLQPYYNEMEKVIASRMIIVISVIIVSALIIYFSMRSFAIKNIYDIGIYRANGVNKGSIILIYGIEIFIISFVATIIGSFAFYLIMNFINQIPVLVGNIGIYLKSFLISSVGLFCINIFVGILPILNYTRLTPSEILSKYDI